MKVADMSEVLDRIAPQDLAEDWDNCGVQVNCNNQITKVLVTLDITSEVIEEAKEVCADCIVSHHPLIMDGIRSIEDKVMIGLIQAGISVFSCHTNFDFMTGGNNEYLEKLLNLKLPMKLADIDCRVQEVLDTQTRIIGEPDRNIESMLTITGAGGFFIGLSDLLITGELKYHEALRARELGICVIEAGHYETEKIFIPNMATRLGEYGIEVCESMVNTNPYMI